MKATFKRIDSQVNPPTKAHPSDAAVDLQTRIDFVLEPSARASIPTGLAVALPPGFAGLVLPRSGHARRHGLGVVNGPGLIDSGYRGEIEVLLINHGSAPVEFHAGDRIAQLAVVAVPDLVWEEAEDLEDSDRGTGGFGSTGV